MAALDAAGDSDRAAKSARFFKTGPGEYGEGDVFLGVRTRAAQARTAIPGITRGEVVRLLASDVHEHRLTGLILAVWEFTHAEMAEREAWVGMYLAQVLADRVNNWDLVDSSAEQILGEWLVGQDYSLLLELAADEELWRRRVGIIGTFAFIRRGDAVPLLSMAPLLIDDRRDLVRRPSAGCSASPESVVAQRCCSAIWMSMPPPWAARRSVMPPSIWTPGCARGIALRASPSRPSRPTTRHGSLPAGRRSRSEPPWAA